MSAGKQVKKAAVKTRRAQRALKIKTLLLEESVSITALARSLNPPRPRSTVSQAIHQGRFPLVIKQIEEALCL